MSVSGISTMRESLGAYAEAVARELESWSRDGQLGQLWAKDASLWTGGDEDRWLGWLDILDTGRAVDAQLDEIAARAAGDDVRSVVVMGMGGSSLCPDVLSRTFGSAPGFPEVLVLDSTVPAQVAAVRARIDPTRSLFIVPSKSGGTIEPNSFMAYFWNQLEGAPGERFVAITDPGTALDERAHALGFSAIAHGDPTIGGRFSALSPFGLVPAAALGIDVPDFVARARRMVEACGVDAAAPSNPGVRLGAILGSLARQGRNKLTIVTSPGIASLGAWLEQLIAESTGKANRGIVPVDGEALAAPAAYGNDRLFALLRLADDPDTQQDAAVTALEAAGHPVVRIEISDPRDLGQEFFRWEIATAVAGAILEIHPFDQPDVEDAKIAARGLMAAVEEGAPRAVSPPLLESDGLQLFADERNASALATGELDACLRSHLERLGPGDYFAINAYVEMCEAHDVELQAIRHAVRDHCRVATTLGYGPRFLHSTGQLHKGGPNRGVFLQITADDAHDLEIPEQRYSFGVLKDAQAQGDFEVLCERERRALRVHLGSDVVEGLRGLRSAVDRALAD